MGKNILRNFILAIEFYRVVQKLIERILFSIILSRFLEHFSRTLFGFSPVKFNNFPKGVL